jgi:hypothetical protein
MRTLLNLTLDNFPAQIRARQRRGLVDDGTDAAGAHNSPDEEGNAGARHKVGLYGEEVADLVNGEPNGRQ